MRLEPVRPGGDTRVAISLLPPQSTTLADLSFCTAPPEVHKRVQTTIDTAFASLSAGGERRRTTSDSAGLLVHIAPTLAQEVSRRLQRLVIRGKIQSYAELRRGWGEPGALPPTPRAVTDALRFLELIPQSAALPRVAPSEDGEINFFWKGPGLYVDVGLRGNGQIDYYARCDRRSIDRDDSEAFGGTSIPQAVVSAIRSG